MEPLSSAQACLAPPEAINVLLVDAQITYRKALRRGLEREHGFTVADDVSRVDAAVSAITATKPDVVIAGLSIRARLRLLRAVQRHNADGRRVRTMLLMETIGRGEVVQAEKFGVGGLVLREAPSMVLYTAVRRVAAGECWLGEKRVETFVEAGRPHGASLDAKPRLTARELEIIAGVCRGDSNGLIAQQLSISPDTVKHHLTHIFSKVGVRTRLQLALFTVDGKSDGL
jgi:DNA-binding NarL/FixJ family response regulator